jgi:hypothetical protein
MVNIIHQNDILNSQNYADANPDKKQAFDQALQNADNILDKAYLRYHFD